MDTATLRRTMVDTQIRTYDVTEPRLLAALGEVPRELYVPNAWRPLAYTDTLIPLADAGDGRPARALLLPMVFARLVQALDIGASDAVLDIGCGLGYSAAVLAAVAGSVVAVEEDAELARRAAETLSSQEVSNAAVVTGPLAAGCPDEAPYDAIVVEGAVEVVPPALFAQLKPGGRLGAIVGTGRAARLTVYLRIAEGISARPVLDAAAPLLPGFQKEPAFVF